MRSKVHFAGHPVHPILVTIPIGAFALALVADLAGIGFGFAQGPLVARFAIAVGIASALLAAITGLVDFVGLPLNVEARRKATWHLILNLSLVALYGVSWWLRGDPLRVTSGQMLSYLAFALLLLSGWFGGELVFRHKIGVDEPADAAPVRR
jgi:uncharacterized membrane protein